MIVTALIGSMIDGSIQPIFGFIFSKFMGLLSIPVEFADEIMGEENYLESNIKYWATVMSIAAVCNGIGAFA